MIEDPIEGWFQRLEQHADLDRTLKEVSGVDSWRAKVLVARVLSLQCQKDAADEAFAVARAEEPEAISCPQALVRKLVAREYELEHELIFGDAAGTQYLDVGSLSAWTDDERVMRALPGFRSVNASRDLFLGSFDRAEEQFRQLLDEAPSVMPTLHDLCGSVGCPPLRRTKATGRLRWRASTPPVGMPTALRARSAVCARPRALPRFASTFGVLRKPTPGYDDSNRSPCRARPSAIWATEQRAS